MSNKTILKSLKKLEMSKLDVSLAIVKEYKKNRSSIYNILYVPIDKPLERRLRNIVINKLNGANQVEEYSLDCPEPEEDLVWSIDNDSTDFSLILDKLKDLNPEVDKIASVEELVTNAKAYLIILRDANEIQIVAFKLIPENWKMKKSRDFIALLFKENRFEDLEDKNIFSISNSIDFFYYDKLVFILSKKSFEKGLNYREGMLAKALDMYNEVEELDIFIGFEILKEKVGNNSRYLRKIAVIKSLGHYKDVNFIKALREISNEEEWEITFKNNKIVVTEGNLESILSILQNKRLHSRLTKEYFDVDGKANKI